MTVPKRILHPTDFSEQSAAALRVATALAHDSGAAIFILHVKEPLKLYRNDGPYEKVFPFPDLGNLKVVLEKVRPSDPDVACEHWLITGDPAKWILELAKTEQVDLIVMGTHGRSGISRVLMGSVAEAVVRRASCPVLTVKQPQEVEQLTCEVNARG